ncbi:hypothetical protein AEQU3_03436 [Aequorivita antarctica]|nr:hypothetical protein AEQU3_03436 [Aequorivita antarctica]
MKIIENSINNDLADFETYKIIIFGILPLCPPKLYA